VAGATDKAPAPVRDGDCQGVDVRDTAPRADGYLREGLSAEALPVAQSGRSSGFDHLLPGHRLPEDVCDRRDRNSASKND
jgi:hypothetical protein